MSLASSLLVPLPALVAKCIRHLSSPTLLAVPDLFASGSVDLHHVGGALLRAAFDANTDAVPLDDPNHVACALTLFFADLPHPLATATLHDCFLDAAAVPDAKERLACWVAIVRLLPPPHFTLLRALAAYLREYCTRGAGSIDDCVDAFAPFLLWSRDEAAVALLRPPPALDVDDVESVVVVVVQSALQTAQLVLLGHLWTVQEAVNHIVASMPRCDAALTWRLELHDGTALDPDELVGVLDFAPMDTLYIETADEMLEPDYVAVARALLRSLVLECDGMLNTPSTSASSTPRTSSDQYGYVPRSSGESAASASAFDAEFDAILDTVALDLDDDDAAPATPQSPARPTSSGGQYGWIGSVREAASPAPPKLMSAEARQVRRKLRQTVTRSRTVLKAEHLVDVPVQRRSRDLALRAAPAHYLRAPPRSNDAIDPSAPPARPRGPPPKKPVMQARKKRVKVESPLAATMTAPAADPPPPVSRPVQPSRPTLTQSPLPTPAPVARPVSPVPPPTARPASLDAYQSPRAAAAATPPRRGPRVAAATTAAVTARPPVASAQAQPMRPVSRPTAAKPLPAPPSGANSAKPHRPTAPPPRAATMAAATMPSFHAPVPAPRPAPPTLVYSNLPPSNSGDGYDNLPAHTLRIQRANMGLAPDDEGLEIEVFDDSLLSQLQQ